jgi:hypothetical protein
MEYSFEFEKARIYINSQKKTLTAIKAETGCDVVINGGLYNMATFKPLCHLKVDGTVHVKDQYKYWGYGWNNADNKLQMVNTYDKLDNYICCMALVKDGKAVTMHYDPGQGGKRGRTAIGTLPDGKTVILCTRDVASESMTPEALQRYCVSKGWKDAVMLDSGGSSQCIIPSAAIISARRVHNVLCFWLKKEESEVEPEVNGLSVKAYSKAKDGTKSLSTNFKVSEFACSDGSDAIFISANLVTVLQNIRTHFGKPVTINSAFRTASKNKAVGGAAYSQHLYGTAADIVVKGVKPKDVAAYAETLMPNSGGIGIYSNFTHIDVRKTKSRWNG